MRLKLKLWAVLLGSLLCFELFVHLFVVSPAKVVFDPKLGPMKAPFSHIVRTYEGFNQYTNDAFGFNNDPLPQALPKHRLLVLGDSFVEAKHVPRTENFVQRLNTLPSVLAYNAGYSGADPRSFSVLVRRFMPVIQPTVLILTVNADDLTSLSSESLPPFPTPTGLKAWLQPLFAHSALLTHLNWKYKPVLQRWWQSWHRQAIVRDTESQGLQVYGKRWRHILQRLKTWHVPIYVVVIPKLRYEGRQAKVEPDSRKDMLIEVAHAAGVHVLRLEQVFQQAFVQQGIVAFGFMNSHLGTGHLNAQGHALVAKALRIKLWLAP